MLHRDETLGVPRYIRSIVFVCVGNIMRSPICEAFFLRALAQSVGQDKKREFAITSAGLNATEGRAAHPWALEAAAEFGLSLGQHRARRLSRAMVDDADAMIAMDYQNVVELISRFPHASRKVFLLGIYASGGRHPAEIRDPFFGDLQETIQCYALIERCVNNLAADLISESVSSLRRDRSFQWSL